MTIEYAIDGVPLPPEAVLINPAGKQGFPSAAWYCDTMTAGLTIDDPEGIYDLASVTNGSWHVFTVDDDADSDRPRIFTGWIVGAAHHRGTYKAGPSRVWDIQIADQNTAAQLEVFRSTAASVRPAETDVERVQSALTSHAMAGTPVVDNGRLDTSHPQDIDAANFVKQRPSDMIVAAAGQSGNNTYIYWDQAAEELAIHYDTVGDGPAAQISISNVPGDWDDPEDPSATVFAPSLDARVETDPTAIATGLLMGWVGGNTYQRNQALIDTLSPSPLSPVNFLRDVVVDSSRIGKAATAATFTARYLADRAVPQELLTFTVRQPASKHNAIQAGDVLSVRFSHLVGFETATDVAVIRRMVRPTDGRVDWYDIDYECGTFATAVTPGGGGGFPHGSSCDVAGSALVQEVYAAGGTVSAGVYDATWDTQPTPGNLLIAAWFTQVNPVPTHSMSGWTFAEDAATLASGGTAGSVIVYYKTAGVSESLSPQISISTSLNLQSTLQEWSGVDTFDTVNTVSVNSGASGQAKITHTPTAGVDALVVAYIHAATVGGGTVLPSTPLSGTTADDQSQYGGVEALASSLHRIVEDASGGYVLGTDRAFGTASAGVSVSFTCSGSDSPPLPGQPVPPNTPTGDVDGSNTDYTVPDEGYAAGSLVFLHDGIDQSDHVTTEDPDTGAFTLDYAPSAGSTLRTGYQGHN